MADAAAPPGLFAQIKSFPKEFWFANFMEMIERWAYYGVRLALGLYIVAATNLGGLEFTHIQKGQIYFWWAIIASFLPMFTGGFADRYGYKKTIGMAIVLKVVGYYIMATQTSYQGFFLGCMILAAGTGLFKPGVQGLIAHSVSGPSASVGWGVFYELVNIGAWIAGLTLVHLKASDMGLTAAQIANPDYVNWTMVFAFNTVLVALNFIPLMMFKEPDINRPAPYATAAEAAGEVWRIFSSSIMNLMQPRLAAFVLIFAGFWFSFHQLFDLLPNFIDDWTKASTMPGGVYVDPQGNVMAGELINLNSFLIMLFMVPVAYVAARATPLVAICVGIGASIVGILLAGSTQSGLFVIAGVAVFTLGEMLSSPRTKDYMGTIAPPDKKALYMGYGEVPSGIGWAVGSLFAGNFYEHNGDKVNFARHWLETNGGMTADAVKAIPKEKVMETLAAKMNVTIPQATEALWNLHSPQQIWYYIAGVGVVSLVAMIAYTFTIQSLDRKNGPPKDGELTGTVPAAKMVSDIPN